MRLLWSLLPCLALAALPSAPASAADEVLPSLEERFSKADVDEVPDFQKHVTPLLGKLGCNGRACHGSFQGQGDFRLSLFGYDFKMDYEGMVKGEDPRVDLADPEFSMIIQKPTLNYPHEGGKRMDEDSWEYRVFLKWIQSGAPYLKDDTPVGLTKLEVTPKEVVFSGSGEEVQMRAVAVWADGSREDVTPLCRFQVNDDQIGTITEKGLLTSKEPGDSHVVVFYDSAVVPVPVMRPVTDLVGEKYPQVATKTEVDRLVVQKLSKLGVVPSDVCSDSEFLRRVSLDLTGTLPSASEVEAFLADSSPNKREQKVNELLDSPGYAAWWTTRLNDWTGNNDYELRNTTPMRNAPSQEWYAWIHKRVENNTPYDDIVEGLVLATGREGGQSYLEYCEEMSDLYRPDSETSFADREGMQWFWARRNLRQPEEKALAFAYTFLGIRIQCAQCHKHPFDQWSQDDYEQFTKFFRGVGFGNNNETRAEFAKLQEELGLKGLRGNDLRRALPKALEEGKTIPFQEVYAMKAAPPPKNPKQRRNNNRNQTPPEAKLLGSGVVDLTSVDDPREPLMNWLRDEQNPYFARAFVNRVWANYFHQGIVSPSDDLSLANPPSNKPLLDFLSDGFVKSGYDMKWVHRTICNSETYQRSWKPNETNVGDERNFSRAVPRRLPAEVAYDALVFATLSDEELAERKASGEKRAITIAGANPNRGNYGDATYALTIFGRSVRESNCDCDRSAEPSLLQTVYLRNDSDLSELITSRNGWLQQVAKEHKLAFNRPNSVQRPANYDRVLANYRKQIEAARKKGQEGRVKSLKKAIQKYVARYGKPEPETTTDSSGTPDASEQQLHAELVEDAYLRTLSRMPSESERQAALSYLSNAKTTTDGLHDLLWALLNTKEFIVNH